MTMSELVVFCDLETLQSDYSAEFLSKRRVPQNLFYFLNGAGAFYSYRNAEVAEIAWQEEVAFFERQALWSEGQRIAFISLGCGNAAPERMLLRHMHNRGHHVLYVGVDSSEAMLEMAMANFEKEPFARAFVQADFSRADFAAKLDDLVGDHELRVFAMIGGTFGNLDQAFVADILTDLIQAKDYLYLDVVPLFDSEERNRRLRERLSNVPENLSEFFNRLLGMLGLSLDQGRIVTVESSDEALNTSRFTFYFDPTAEVRVSCFDRETDLHPGERIELMSIRAYDVHSLSVFLADRGFRLIDTYVPDVGSLSHLWQRLLLVKDV
jgi:uncharacterized SAM-dependent methyltransferase